MNQDCERCKGTCCKWMILPPLGIDNDMAREWAQARGLRVIEHEGTLNIMVPSKCPRLDRFGRCSIERSKPKWCQLFPVGCRECLICQRLR